MHSFNLGLADQNHLPPISQRVRPRKEETARGSIFEAIRWIARVAVRQTRLNRSCETSYPHLLNIITSPFRSANVRPYHLGNYRADMMRLVNVVRLPLTKRRHGTVSRPLSGFMSRHNAFKRRKWSEIVPRLTRLEGNQRYERAVLLSSALRSCPSSHAQYPAESCGFFS